MWISYVFFPLSDAFDFQFGAVILRLKEGLDVSHIQGQGIRDMHTHTTRENYWAVWLFFQY